MTEETSKQAASPNFIYYFVLLAILSGITIGTSKIVTTLYALSLGASPMQVGIISGMESLGMVLVTVPAGFIIARYGARIIYFTASLGPLLIYLAMPWVTAWYLLAIGKALVGLCIPFRIVSMNSSFLQQLKTIGIGKAGWYRGSLTIGMAMLGPAFGNFVTHHASYLLCYVIVSALFGVMAIYSLAFFPDKEQGVQQIGGEQAGILAQVKAMLQNPDIAESCVIEFVSSSAGSVFSTFIILVALTVNGLTQQDGINLMLVQGIASVGALFLAGNFLRIASRRSAYAISLVLAVGSLLFLGFGQNFLTLAAGSVLLSLAAAFVHLVNMMQLGNHSADKSKISSLYNQAQMLGGTAGAFVGGLLTKFIGVQALFLAWIPVLIGTAVLLRIHHENARKTLQLAE